MSLLRKAPAADAARWVVERTAGFAENVGSLVPHGFEAYARVLHPASSGFPDDADVSWADIAATTGRIVHPQVQWPHLAFIEEITDINELQDPPPGAPWQAPPEEGSLDRDTADVLAGLLGEHTSDPERCWFAAWDGWGASSEDIQEAPAFRMPGRRYFLLQGSVDAITQTVCAPASGYQSASLWWPDDRAWFVATEVDLESTYLGGTEACIDAIVRHSNLEALPVEITDGVTWAADTLNPNPLRLEH